MTVTSNTVPTLTTSTPTKATRGVGFTLGISLLDRYILAQLANYFLLGIVALTVTLLFSDTLLDMLFDLQNYGMPAEIIIALVLLQIPKLISVAIPMGAVLATLLTYNSLQHNLELITARMSGLSLFRLVIPAVMLALMATLATYWLQNAVVPKCVAYTQTLRALALTEYALPLKQSHFSYKQFNSAQHLERLIYVNTIENKSLNGVITIDLTHPKTLQVTQAKAGRWTGENIELTNASIYTIATNGKITNTSVAEKLTLNDFIRRPKFTPRIKPQDQSMASLQQAITDKIKANEPVPTKLSMNYWSKFFFPLTIIPLALIGIPLIMAAPRQSNQLGFVLTMVFTFLYYILEHSLGQLGSLAIMPPAIAAALPVVIITLLAVVLLSRKNKTLA